MDHFCRAGRAARRIDSLVYNASAIDLHDACDSSVEPVQDRFVP